MYAAESEEPPHLVKAVDLPPPLDVSSGVEAPVGVGLEEAGGLGGRGPRGLLARAVPRHCRERAVTHTDRGNVSHLITKTSVQLFPTAVRSEFCEFQYLVAVSLRVVVSDCS